MALKALKVDCSVEGLMKEARDSNFTKNGEMFDSNFKVHSKMFKICKSKIIFNLKLSLYLN